MKLSLRSLSFRLLVLTVFFVMLAEVLIFTPSIARYRLVYLTEKLDAAHLAALAVNVSPDRLVSQELTFELLDHVGAYDIVLFRDGTPMEMLHRPLRPEPHVSFDLTTHGFFQLIADAFVALFQTRNRIVKVVGPAPKDPSVVVQVTIDEYPMRMEMYDYSWRILNLSILISIVTAALVFISLRWMMVRPLETITRSLVAFRREPEDRSSDLDDEGRREQCSQHRCWRDPADVPHRVGLRLGCRLGVAMIGCLIAAVEVLEHRGAEEPPAAAHLPGGQTTLLGLGVDRLA